MHFYVYTLLPQKIASDRDYVGSWSLGRDISILLRTVKALLFRSKAQAEQPSRAVVRSLPPADSTARKKVV
jgi:hypothetical protein